MSARLPAWLRWTTAVAAFAALGWYVGPMRLATTVAAAHPLWILLYFAAFLAIPFLYGVQMHRALALGGHRESLRDVMAAAVHSWSIGSLTPARAGDLSLAYFLDGRVPQREVLGVIAADKLLSLAVLATLAALSALTVDVPYASTLATGVGVVLVGAAIAFGALRWPGLDTRVRALVLAPRFLAWMGIVNVLRWGYICAINLLVFRAVDARPDLGTVTAATAVGRIIAIVPLSIGGLGLKEPAQILIYRGAGITADAVVAVSVIGMACGFAVAAVAPLLLRRPPGRPE